MAKNKPLPKPETFVDPYRAESDANTLARAAEVTADKGRHKAALAHTEKQYNAVKSMGAKSGAPVKPMKPKAPKPVAKPKPAGRAKRGR